MRNFYRLAQGVDVVPLMNALMRQPELWNQNRLRTTFPGTPHGEVDDIWLRFTDTSNYDAASDSFVGGDVQVWHPAFSKLPQAKPIILDVMRRVEAYELSRVIITRLHQGGRILPHADARGEYATTPDRARYHVVLRGEPGSLYRTGDETVCMRTGEAWWFNPLVEHEIINNSNDDRIHMLVDVRVCQ